MQKKILPSLFHLFEGGKLPQMFKVVGFSKDALSDKEYGNYILGSLIQHKDIDIKTCSQFCELFSYQAGLFQNLNDYKNLEKTLKAVDDKWGVCSNKLFYLAVPPEFYKTIFENLAASLLTRPCSMEEGWTRVLVEKPFGRDLATAKKLDKLLSRLFKEEQIYRIDHYLAKEMMQNILAFRFSNNLFENNWNNKLIEKIIIRLQEDIGVEDRGGFYDAVGALQDVGQNHLLQMLALITMENPVDFNDKAIRTKRLEILEGLLPPSADEIKKFSFRAQYLGYRKIEGVARDSNTETYFKVRAFLSSLRWQGTPIILESGKRLKERRKEIVVYLKHPIPCLCPKGADEHYQNKIIFSLEPEEGVTFELWRKKPGLTFEIEKKDCLCSFREEEKISQYTEEYEKLLYDCVVGDQTLFVSSKEIESMWRFIDPIVKNWRKNAVPLKTYQPNTDQPIVESGWINQGIKPAFVPLGGTTAGKKIAIVGLGKMGKNMAARLSERGWKVLGFDKNPDFEKLASGLAAPRVVWLMVPSGKAVDEVIFGKSGLVNSLSRGDIIIDGGNSFYKDSISRAKKLEKFGIIFIDVGVSGGPEGARQGACLMVGGKKKNYENLLPLFIDLAADQGVQFFEGQGAGHFIKMIHNGIEYGMMQAIAEGFTILKKAEYKLNLSKVAHVYNHGSVIESRLIFWLQKALELHGDDLKDVMGSVARTGEGDWTLQTAQEMKLKTKVIKEALKFRVESERKPSYTGKIVSALREQFGGHKVIKIK